MMHLINDILDSSQLEAKKLILNYELTSIEQVFKECIDLLKFQAENKSLDLSFEIADDCP